MTRTIPIEDGPDAMSNPLRFRFPNIRHLSLMTFRFPYGKGLIDRLKSQKYSLIHHHHTLNIVIDGHTYTYAEVRSLTCVPFN